MGRLWAIQNLIINHRIKLRVSPKKMDFQENKIDFCSFLVNFFGTVTPTSHQSFGKRTLSTWFLHIFRRSNNEIFDFYSSVRQRRQRQFGAEQLIAPVVVLQTGRAEPARVHIKELPNLKSSRSRQPASGFFVNPSATGSLPTLPPTPPPAPTSSATSFARFNQFGSTLFTLGMDSNKLSKNSNNFWSLAF